MLMQVLAAALLVASPQQPATPAPAPRPSAPATPAPAPRTAAPTAPPAARATGTTVEIRITDRSGTPAVGAHVSATGPAVRDGMTTANGAVVFRTMAAGTYRIRAEQDGFITLEKELTVRAGTPATTEMALSAAPPAPAPPPTPVVAAPPPPAPAPVAAPLTGARGEPRVLSITGLAEKSLSGRDNVKVVPVGCTNITNARLIVLRESLPSASYADADETLYLVAGEATITIDSKQQALTAGWFSMLPRGTNFEVVRKGRNPAIFLSQLNGRPCGDSGQ